MGKNAKTTATIVLSSVKDPDGWGEIIHELGLSEAKARKFFEFHEYASLEIEIDADMNIVGGRVLPL